jgi:hypothetical protein
MKRLPKNFIVGAKQRFQRPLIIPNGGAQQKKIMHDESVVIGLNSSTAQVDSKKELVIHHVTEKRRPTEVFMTKGKHRNIHGSGLQDLSSTINATMDTMNQQKEDQPSSARSIIEDRPWGDPINLFRNNEGKKALPRIPELAIDGSLKREAVYESKEVVDYTIGEGCESPTKTDGQNQSNSKKKGKWMDVGKESVKRIKKLLGRGSVEDLKASKEQLHEVDAKRTGKVSVSWRDRVKSVLESNTVTYMYSFIIMLSIFGDDIRRILLQKKYDPFVDYILIFIMSLFLLEILNTMITSFKKYVFGGLEFLLDLLATLSILFDIAMFSETYLAPLNK